VAGLERDEKHRYRWEGGKWQPGVTSIIKALDKSGPLVGWAKRETAACAVRNLDTLATMVRDGGADSAARWLSSIPDYQRTAAADLGTRVHALAEAINNGQDIEVDSETEPFVTEYLRWQGTTKPKVVNAEYMVYSALHGYGGTADMAAWINAELWLIDIKTGKAVYPETALQLAGLRWADWAGKLGDPTKYKNPPATRFGVLHVRPDGAELVPFNVTADDFDAFCALRWARSWLDERAPVVIERKAA
jgi:hypothetical protein